jgi:periplasmic mercuric ion binding protein
MKTKVMSLLILFMLGVFTVVAADKTEKFEVKGGNCDECKEHVQKAALLIKGVLKANWDMETKLLEVVFDDTVTNLKDIEVAIANAGHDTPNNKTTQEAFDALPECCKYER